MYGPRTIREFPRRAGRYLALYQESNLADPVALQRELTTLEDDFGIEVATYTLDGRLLASTYRSPPPPLPPPDLRDLRSGPERMPGGGFVAPLHDDHGELVAYSMARPVRFHGWIRHVLLMLGLVLAVLALASFPLARSIARPVEQLTVAARRLGSGDLSARTGIEQNEELGELGAAFDDMAERIERLVRSEKELLANVSHELRTPMARIRVALELASEGDAERARRYLGEIGADLADLERLVEDVLATARLDLAAGRAGDGAPPLHRKPTDLKELLERAAARFRTDNPSRVLETSLDDAIQLEVDPDLLRRAVMNLLDNARKYSEAAIGLSLRREGQAVAIEVKDRGIGIAPEDMERIFTPFFRTDRSRARGTGGVGLGLPLVRRIAEAHGGRAFATSAPGEGSTLRIELPV
jgi:signal transduction histidine kinase